MHISLVDIFLQNPLTYCRKDGNIHIPKGQTPNGKQRKLEENTMKEIKIFEQAMQEGNEFFRTNKINLTLFTAYRQQGYTENKLIDFSEVIWEEDIEPIAEFLKAEGITEFTISSTFSSLIQTLAGFEKHGYRMNGLTEVNANYTDFTTGKKKIVPAIRMSLN